MTSNQQPAPRPPLFLQVVTALRLARLIDRIVRGSIHLCELLSDTWLP